MSRAAALVCVAAMGAACAARTELYATGDASSDSASSGDASGDAIDARADSPFSLPDAQPPLDAIDECLATGELCSTSGECCSGLCFHGECDLGVPPYGGPPPED